MLWMVGGRRLARVTRRLEWLARICAATRHLSARTRSQRERAAIIVAASCDGTRSRRPGSASSSLASRQAYRAPPSSRPHLFPPAAAPAPAPAPPPLAPAAVAPAGLDDSIASLRAASCSRPVSTPSGGRCTYRTTLPRMNRLFTVICEGGSRAMLADTRKRGLGHRQRVSRPTH